MTSRIRTLQAILTLALGVLVAHPAFAQLPPPDPARVQDAIDVTDRRIQQAKDLLAASPNQQAAAEVDQAVSLQGIAKQYYAQGRYGAAARATFEARVHADRAVALLKGLPDPGRVQDQLARTREVLDRARDRLAQCDLPAPREMLRTALDMQARAELAYSETRYLAALQLTMSARERALRALQLCNAGESLDDTVEHALQRTDDELARAHEVVGADAGERARQLLANADSVQLRAKAEAHAGHPRVALRLTRMAREQAYRAIRGATSAGRR
jgi:predicted S18 family serine protease